MALFCLFVSYLLPFSFWKEPIVFFSSLVIIKKRMDTFDIILEISSTILPMQKFFLVVSSAHKKFGCNKGTTCKGSEFIEGLDKVLFSDKTYDDMRTLFIEHCVKLNTILNCMY